MHYRMFALNAAGEAPMVPFEADDNGYRRKPSAREDATLGGKRVRDLFGPKADGKGDPDWARVLPDGRAWAFLASTPDSQVYAPGTPDGVHEVVTALRAWVREEARKLVADVDPPATAPAPAR